MIKHTVHLITVKALNHAIVLTERQEHLEHLLTCAGLCIAQMHIFADGSKAIIYCRTAKRDHPPIRQRAAPRKQ